ncbi:hypothetical protein HDV00_000982 [Rhizophlyctis rosea]|nr:hypothetical protein HDV00_000982 [Rhizophlyctis rosea]
MPTTHLRITITPHRPNSLPGYDGDRRVEWSISEDAVSTSEAQRKTRDALRVLRAFWEEAAPEGLRFEEFARTVLSDGALAGTSAAPSSSNAGAQNGGADSNGTNNGNNGAGGANAGEGNAAGTDGKTEEDSRGQAERELDLVDPLAERLVRHPTVLPAFLSDLRDWDSFRLLLRRHGGEVPFRQVQQQQQQQLAQQQAQAAADGSAEPLSLTSSMLTPTIDRTSYVLTALAGRERLWQDERASLHAALWAAGEQVRALVSALTDALDRVAAVTINQPAPTNGAATSSKTSSEKTAATSSSSTTTTHPPPPSTSIPATILTALQTAESLAGSPTSPLSPTSGKKNVTFSDTVIRREVLKESALHQTMMWHAQNGDGGAGGSNGAAGGGGGVMPEPGTEWREQGWLRELAEREDEVLEGLEGEEGDGESGEEGGVGGKEGVVVNGVGEEDTETEEEEGGGGEGTGAGEEGGDGTTGATGTTTSKIKRGKAGRGAKKSPSSSTPTTPPVTVSILKTSSSTPADPPTPTTESPTIVLATPQTLAIQPPSAPSPPVLNSETKRDKNDPGEKSGRSAVDGERPEIENGSSSAAAAAVANGAGTVLIASGRRKRRGGGAEGGEESQSPTTNGVEKDETQSLTNGVNGIQPILLASGRRRNSPDQKGEPSPLAIAVNGEDGGDVVFVDGDEGSSSPEEGEGGKAEREEERGRESMSSSVAVVGVGEGGVSGSGIGTGVNGGTISSPVPSPSASPVPEARKITPASTPSTSSIVTLVDVPATGGTTKEKDAPSTPTPTTKDSIGVTFGRATATLSRMGSKSKLRPSEKEKRLDERREREREKEREGHSERIGSGGAGGGGDGGNGIGGIAGGVRRVWRKVSKEILKSATGAAGAGTAGGAGTGGGMKGR